MNWLGLLKKDYQPAASVIMPSLSLYNPSTSIPDLAGRTLLVTGGTSGLGAETILALSQHNPGHIFFSGRNAASAEAVISRVTSSTKLASTPPVTFLKCDLSSLDSVASAAKEFRTKSEGLDVLFCNAGILAHPPGLTTDGYEIQFGTNHLGHALLIRLLLPTLQRSLDPRIVINSSEAFQMAPSGGIAFDSLKTTQSWRVLGDWLRYGQSKMANILYAKELAQRYPEVLSVSLHPGVIKTGMVENAGLFNRFLLYIKYMGKIITIEQGAYTQLWAGTSERGKIENGGFYYPIGELNSGNATARDARLAKKLWDWTEEQLQPWLQ